MASVAQTDACIGIVLQALAQLNLTAGTIIVLTADHGYFLGEHGMFAKNSLFDTSTRVPLVFHVPLNLAPAVSEDLKALKVIDGVMEHLSLFRTLANLAGITVPRAVAGVDYSPLVRAALSGASVAWPADAAAYSQVTRCQARDQKCSVDPYELFTAMGFSVRTAQWRYVVWVAALPPAVPVWTSVLARELYDHRGDAGFALQDEAVNVQDQFPLVCAQLHATILARFQNDTYVA